MFELISNSTEETMFFGEGLGRLLEPGAVVLFRGDLGAGKTHLAKGIARGLEVEDQITSPTFTLINEYQGRLPLYHMDFYRLGEPEEAMDLGVDEYFYGRGVTLIEWPERIAGFLPKEALGIDITALDGDSRKIKVTARGDKYVKLVEELKKIVHSGN